MINTINIQQIFEDVKKEVKNIIPFSDNIYNKIKIINAKQKLGVCHKTSFAGLAYYSISISKYLLECDIKLIKEVLIHELIHTCNGCFNHGKNFLHFAFLVNNELGYAITTQSKDKQFKNNIPHKYKLTCLKCGRVFYRERLPKNKTNLKHALCKGLLKIEKLY